MDQTKKLQNIGDLIKAMADLGMCAPPYLNMDGKIHRFNLDGRDKKQSGWYLINSVDNRACVGDWRSGQTETFYFDEGVLGGAGDARTPPHKATLSKTIKDHISCYNEQPVSELWERLAVAPNEHPYLREKKIDRGHARINTGGLLVIAVESIDSYLHSLQYIYSDGKKRFVKGHSVKGYGHWAQGSLSDTIAHQYVYVVEGYATGMSVAAHTTVPVFCSLSASNIEPVVCNLFNTVDKSVTITVIADNDSSGVGEKFARIAHQKYGAKIIVIPTEGDANDFVNAGGDLKALLDAEGDKSRRVFDRSINPKTIKDYINKPVSQWLVHANQFVHATEPMQWLIENWLPKHALVMLHGSSGIGKSFVALDWSLRISTAIDHYCNESVSDGVVVYLAGEGASGLQSRLAVWLAHHKQSDPRLWLSKGSLLIDGESSCRRIISEITAICGEAQVDSPGLIVIDTLHRFFGGDENSAQDVAKFIANCSHLMDTFSCSVLIVHHTGNTRTPQNRCRGSSAWRGAMDVELHLSDPDGHDCMELMQCKTKDFIKQSAIKTKLVTIEVPTPDNSPNIISAVPKFKKCSPETAGKLVSAS